MYLCTFECRFTERNVSPPTPTCTHTHTHTHIHTHAHIQIITPKYTYTNTHTHTHTSPPPYQVSEEDYDPDRDVLIDIPVDDNTALVGVALIEINDKTETEKLYEDTRCLFEAFDPSKVLSVKDSGSENAYVAQKLLYTTIRRGCESLGVELDRPQAVYDSTQLHKTSPQVFPPTPPASTSSPLALHKLTYSKMQPSPPQVQPVRSLADLEDSDSSSEYDEIRPGALKLFHGSIPGSARVKNMDATRKENNPSRHPQLASSPSQRFSLPSSQFLPPSQVAAPLEARVSSMEAQLAVLGRGTKRQAAMEQEMIRMKTTVEKLLPQIYALQSKLYQLTKISQVYIYTDVFVRTTCTCDILYTVYLYMLS